MRASKDLARRLRFDRLPRPDFIRRWFLLASLVGALAGLSLWVLFGVSFRQRQYLPGPVSQSHATFGEQCDKCHTTFRSVQNSTCLECHPARSHSQFEDRTPNCRDCHVEHRELHVFLTVSNRACVDCHGQLVSKRPEPLIQAAVGTFAAHPDFSPLRQGRTDQTALRFNHKIHLTSDKIAAPDKLACASCHQPEPDGRLMRPIVFEPHCKRCHEQKPPNPIGGIEAPHKPPDVVRAEVTAQLLVLAVQNPDGTFKGRPSTLPGVADRPAISEARSLDAFQGEWIQKLEATLYKPFDNTPPVLEHNPYCFLCHFEHTTSAAGELAQITPTKIPRRWLERGEFSHRKHDLTKCQTCHANIEVSELTSDTNLPANVQCAKCHVDGAIQSAGTDCMLCHLYHDTSRDPELRARGLKEVSIEALTGR